MARTVIKLQCEHCGKEVLRNKGQVQAHTFCDRNCYLKSSYRTRTIAAANIARSPNATTTEPCGACGTPATRYISSRGNVIFCSRECHDEYRRANPKTVRNAYGYLKDFVGPDYPGATKQGYIMQHRRVMQQALGRQLERHENVHHINGIKTDNSIENLELWTTSQPQGQRVEDKIRWAKEFLALYERDSESANVEVQEHGDGDHGLRR